ncbi:MAG: DUF1570 domain-containing protein [Planctomycetia bacterium]|nr:DUF1570 domain-containing protein [Planctomycetia bacterium]
MRLLAAVLALATAASAEPAVRIVASKEKGWATLVATTATYEIRSDADAKTLQQVATALEDLHRAFVQTFKDRIDPEEAKELLHVCFYRTRKAFLANMQMGGGVGMGPGGPPGGKGGGPQMPGGGDGGPGGYYDPGTRTLHTGLEQPAGDDWTFVLKHEGTHQLLHNRLAIGGGQPGVTSAIWFNEGFASYWAMTVWKGKDVAEGGVMKKLLDEFKRMESSKTLMPLKTLVGGQPNPMQMQAYYAQGWALCHFLRRSKYREKFAAYLDREKAGKISWEDFKEALGIADAEAFEKEFLAHMKGLK